MSCGLGVLGLHHVGPSLPCPTASGFPLPALPALPQDSPVAGTMAAHITNELKAILDNVQAPAELEKYLAETGLLDFLDVGMITPKEEDC